MARGEELFAAIRGEAPSLFDRNRWVGQVMDWCMRNEEFKLRLFRFVDVFPSLSTDESFTRHLAEYFGAEDQDLPAVLKWGARSAGRGGKLGAAILNRFIRHNIEAMAHQFILAEESEKAVEKLNKLRQDGFAFSVDLLGEATVNEEEAGQYVESNLALLRGLDEAQASWESLPGTGPAPDADWGHAPSVNLSVKPTACYSQTRPQDFEGSVAAILARLEPIYEKVIGMGGFLCLDMETWQTKGITQELFRRLRSNHRDYPHLGIALQSYLRDTDGDLADLVAWANREKSSISVRLVKGAYWDFETIRAGQNGWPSPVYTRKAETDAAFERHARKILENQDICHLACGSHNIRSIAAVMETAAALGVPEDRYEFQVLYGMAEPVRKALLSTAGRVRLYCPLGEMIPGMAYLVRRLLENTANTSFLRQSFAEGEATERLLIDPAEQIPHDESSAEVNVASPSMAGGSGDLPPFRNRPAVNFALENEREAFRRALAEVRGGLGHVYPLYIGGEERKTEKLADSVNPADPEEVVGRVCLAGLPEAEEALDAARRVFPAWRDTPARERAGYLLKAAELARQRRANLAAWQVLEIGKQWDQADADVAEAVDFLVYYAGEMLRLEEGPVIGEVPGEENRYVYQPKGIAAVIAPWNFPLAISCGMAAAALVTGNCVLFKPSSLTPVTGRLLTELFRDAGLPPGVFNFLPGPGGSIGEFLVSHPDIALIAFTGSMDVGLNIIRRAAEPRSGQSLVKKVVAEMGGKNAIIIDDDADLDEAVPQVIASTFSFQGQKCSACSRVIVLDTVYNLFVNRLVKAAAALKIGPAEDPANTLGPVADETARQKIFDYIELGKAEGELLFTGEIPRGRGWYVPPTIIGGIRPDHRLAREEIFGPVLAVMRAADFDQAIAWANATPFALTGGVFSRSPAHLDRARREFNVGNLYFNRPCTAAMVGRQPFGGFHLSGTGTKAGGPDYLLHFMDPRVITENTMRRGFAPTLPGNRGDATPVS